MIAFLKYDRCKKQDEDYFSEERLVLQLEHIMEQEAHIYRDIFINQIRMSKLDQKNGTWKVEIQTQFPTSER